MTGRLPPGSASGPREADFVGAPSAQKRAAFSFLKLEICLSMVGLFIPVVPLPVADKNQETRKSEPTPNKLALSIYRANHNFFKAHKLQGG